MLLFMIQFCCVMLLSKDNYLIQRKDALTVFSYVTGTAHLYEVLLQNGENM